MEFARVTINHCSDNEKKECLKQRVYQNLPRTILLSYSYFHAILNNGRYHFLEAGKVILFILVLRPSQTAFLNSAVCILYLL